MSMRQRLLLVVGGLLMAASVVAPLEAAYAAAEGGAITKSGWWTRNPAASAPDDGLNVGNAPDGPVSVAAVEIASSTGLSRAVLILTEEGGIQADSAKLAVCVTPNDWDAGAAQPMAAAPKAECETNQVELARNASSSTWAADVTTLVSDIDEEGSVSLMIVPSGNATVPVGFEVRFQKPELSSDAAESSTTPTDFSSDFSSSDSSSSDSSSSGGSSSGGGFSGGTGTTMSDSSTFAPTFDASATPAPVAPTTADGAAGAPVASDAPPADTTATTAPAELAAIPTQAALGAATSGGGSTVQAIFFVIVATIAGVGAGAGRWYLRSRNPDTTFA